MDDGRVWESLWHGYLDFYRGVLTPEITERTWDALCDPTPAAHGLVAEQGDQLAGSRTWSSIPPCEPRTRSVI